MDNREAFWGHSSAHGACGFRNARREAHNSLTLYFSRDVDKSPLSYSSEHSIQPHGLLTPRHGLRQPQVSVYSTCKPNTDARTPASHFIQSATSADSYFSVSLVLLVK